MDPFHPTADQSDRLVRIFARLREAEARERVLLEEEIVIAYLPLASAVAGRYRDRGVEVEDLRQVACAALVSAVRRFDVTKGPFAPFANATIAGEIKHYFRDCGWMIRPPRAVQELYAEVGRLREEGLREQGSLPSVDQLAARLDVDRRAVATVVDADGCFRLASLDAPRVSGGPTEGSSIATEWTGLERAEDWADFLGAWAALDAGEKRLVRLRFFEDLTQSQIAGIIGVSQMQVSRHLTALLAKLRDRMHATDAA